MYQILKIFGVTPEALARLHKVLDGDTVKTEQIVGIDCVGAIGEGKLTCAELLHSKFEKSTKTYLVEIKVWIAMPCFDPKRLHVSPQNAVPTILFPSRKILSAIYEALDAYPEKEELIKLAKS